MKLFFLFLFISTQSMASSCFIIKENEKVIKEEGECHKAFAPNSTFKIPLALMGFDSGILKSENSPVIPFKKEYQHRINVCKGDHNPKEWMRDSCVWFSQVITKELGLKKFKTYVENFNYGNKDIFGDEALQKSWLENSLKITPVEQVAFLQGMLNKKYSISNKAYALTTQILYQQELAGGWKLYGKTGNGMYRPDLQQGWFVGWIEKNGRQLVFAHHIADETKQDVFASFRSKSEAINKLWYVISDLQK